MRTLVFSLLATACAEPSGGAFVLETSDCVLVNNVTVNGNASQQWNGCRVYWSGVATVHDGRVTEMLTVELTRSNTSGSFVAPGLGWARASVRVPDGGINTVLTAAAHPPSSLPSWLPADTIALQLPIVGCNYFSTAGMMVETMADVGADSASLSLTVDGTCSEEIFYYHFSGSIRVSAGGATPGVEPETIVGPLP